MVLFTESDIKQFLDINQMGFMDVIIEENGRVKIIVKNRHLKRYCHSMKVLTKIKNLVPVSVIIKYEKE